MATNSPIQKLKEEWTFDRTDWRDNIVIIALILVFVFFAVTTDYFVSSTNIINILRQAAIVLLLALGMTFVIISAEIDISVGAVTALSGVLAAIVLNAGYNIIFAVLTGLGVGLAVGAINGAITVRAGVPSFLVTLGMLGAARGLALLITHTQPVVIRDQTFFTFFSGTIGPIPRIVIWTGAVMIISHFVLSSTRFGRHIYATGDNAQAAQYTGISTSKVKFTALLFTGGCAGLAGLLLIGRLSAARPTMASGLELSVIAAVILGGTSLFGGRGWIPGTVAGALLITVINNGLVLNGLSTPGQQLIRGIIIILAVAFRATEEDGGWI